jgi:hypothetical protein
MALVTFSLSILLQRPGFLRPGPESWKSYRGPGAAGAYVLSAFFVMGISAYHLLHKEHRDFVLRQRISPRISLSMDARRVLKNPHPRLAWQQKALFKATVFG